MRHTSSIRISQSALRYLFLALLTSLLFTSQVQATTYTWDIVPGTVGVGNGTITGGTGTWDTTNGNWTTNGGANNVAWPTVGTDNDAVFGGTAGTVTISGGVTANDVTLNTTGYSIDSSTLTLNGTPIITTASGVSATINSAITNTATATTLSGTGTHALTLGGTGTFTGQELRLEGASSTNNTLNVVSGASISTGNFHIRQQTGVTSYTGNYNQTGGTVTATGEFALGASTTGSGGSNISNATISGGTLNVNTILYLYKWATSNLSVTNSGVVNANSLRIGWVDSSPTGTITLGDGTNFSGGTSINDGGTSGVLNVTSWNIQPVRSYTLAFKGGTLKAGGAGAPWLPASSFTSATVQDAGGIIDNGGNAITIAQVLSHGGTNATDGGLVFNGSGTTTLSGANGYNGGSTLSRGTLVASTSASALGSGAVTLGNTSTGANNIQLTLSVSPSNNITVSNNGTGTATIFGNLQFGGALGTITLNRATIFEIPNTGTGDWHYGFGSSISGSGPLTLKGGGGGTSASAAGNRINIGGNNTGFSGGVTVQSGAFQPGHANAAGTGSITLGNASSGSAVTQLRLNANIGNTIIVSSSAPSSAAGIGTANSLQVLSGALQVDRALTINGGSDRLTWSGAGAVWSGSGDITISGGRVTHDTAANTWTGNMTINASSTFQAGNNASLIASNSVTANGILRVIASGAGGTVMINALNGSGAINGDTGGGNYLKTLSIGTNGGNGSFSGVISNGSGGDTLAITKAGGGTQTLSGASTYTGATSITNGTLSLSGSLTGSSVSTSSTGIMSQTAAGSIAGIGGAFTQGSSGTSILGGTNTYGGTTTVSSGILQITGTASNTTAGNTLVNNGELQMGKTAGINAIGSNNLFVGDGSGAAASAIAKLLDHNQIPNTTDVTIYSDGKFDLNGRDETINNLLDGAPAGGTVDGTSGTPTFTVQGGSFSGVITDTAGTLKLVKSSSNNLQLAGANTYAGATDIQAGILAIGTGNNRLPTTTTVTLGNGATSGKLRLAELSSPTARSQSLSGLLTSGNGTTNRVVGGAAGTSVLTLDIAGSNTYDGFLGGPSTNENNLALTKTGVGTLTLTAVNTYNGVTNVNQGTLRVNGTHNGGGLYTVANGAELGGSGTISAAVNVLAGGITSPGNSPGTLTVGSLDYDIGAVHDWEVNGAFTHDIMNVTGLLNFDGPMTINVYNLGVTSEIQPSMQFVVWDYGTVAGFNPLNFTIADGGGFIVSGASVFDNGSQIMITGLMSVPEPSTWVLGLIGLAGLGLVVWRRKRGA